MFWKKRISRLCSRHTKNTHLDFAGTTPLDLQVSKKMQKFASFDFFNPSSIYFEAKKIKEILETYRKNIAQKLQVKPSEIIFTNGGTESINMAILGLVRKLEIRNSKSEIRNSKHKKVHFISTKIEHPAVLESLKEAERLGVDVTLLDVDEEGLISLEDLRDALREETKLVSICYATSEFGSIQNISKISREIYKYKEKINRNAEDFPYFHTDASQAGLTLDLNVDRLGVDMMTLDGSKIYGPKATGCLIKKRYVDISPIMFGGGQEQGIRPGTENVSGIVGFCEALLFTFERKEKDKKHFDNIQKYMLDKIAKEIPEAEINGSLKSRLLNNVNICIKGINSEFAVIMMDELGINCSPMTACKSMKGDGRSYAIEALRKPQCAGSSIRFSFGRETTKKDIDKAIKALRRTIDFQFSNK